MHPHWAAKGVRQPLEAWHNGGDKRGDTAKGKGVFIGKCHACGEEEGHSSRFGPNKR